MVLKPVYRSWRDELSIFVKGWCITLSMVGELTRIITQKYKQEKKITSKEMSL